MPSEYYTRHEAELRLIKDRYIHRGDRISRYRADCIKELLRREEAKHE